VDCTTDVPELGRGLTCLPLKLGLQTENKKEPSDNQTVFLIYDFWVVQMAGGHGRFPKIPLCLADCQIH